ncbi:MAG: hypothetical protein V4850_31085 [Myxococcota bacterium]
MSTTPPATPLPLLWAAFIGSHVMFVAITFFVPGQPIAQANLLPILAVPAMIVAGIAAEGSLVARVAPQAQTWCLIRFALAEVAGVLGLLVYFFSGEHLVQLVCAACGLMAHLLAFPSARALEGHAALLRP